MYCPVIGAHGLVVLSFNHLCSKGSRSGGFQTKSCFHACLQMSYFHVFLPPGSAPPTPFPSLNIFIISPTTSSLDTTCPGTPTSPYYLSPALFYPNVNICLSLLYLKHNHCLNSPTPSYSCPTPI